MTRTSGMRRQNAEPDNCEGNHAKATGTCVTHTTHRRRRTIDTRNERPRTQSTPRPNDEKHIKHRRAQTSRARNGLNLTLTCIVGVATPGSHALNTTSTLTRGCGKAMSKATDTTNVGTKHRATSQRAPTLRDSAGVFRAYSVAKTLPGERHGDDEHNAVNRDRKF